MTSASLAVEILPRKNSSYFSLPPLYLTLAYSGEDEGGGML